MIKLGEKLLRLQEENQKLGAKVYALSSQIVSSEQDKIDLVNEIESLKDGIAKAREEMETEFNNNCCMANIGLNIAIGIFNKYLPKEE